MLHALITSESYKSVTVDNKSGTSRTTLPVSLIHKGRSIKSQPCCSKGGGEVALGFNVQNSTLQRPQSQVLSSCAVSRLIARRLRSSNVLLSLDWMDNVEGQRLAFPGTKLLNPNSLAS